jgi:hypothetical protein
MICIVKVVFRVRGGGSNFFEVGIYFFGVEWE